MKSIEPSYTNPTGQFQVVADRRTALSAHPTLRDAEEAVAALIPERDSIDGKPYAQVDIVPPGGTIDDDHPGLD